LTESLFARYLKTVDLPKLLHKLGVQDVDLVAREIHHFTKKEAEKRDKIVLNYFGEDGVKRIVNSIANCLSTRPKLTPDAKVLDMGAGSGFFTVRVAHQAKKLLPNVSFYAMDATPAMLLALEKKEEAVTPFFGIAENIIGSIRIAGNYAVIPKRFDALFSTLMLHHCPDINKVFRSVRQALKTTGKAVIVDLCTHPFTEFRDDMGDVHLGFDPEQIEQAADRAFSKVAVRKLPGICCSSSGRSAELFIATLKP